MTDRPKPPEPAGEEAGERHPQVRLSPDTLPGKRVAAILLAAVAFALVLVGLAWLLLAQEMRAERPRELARAGEPVPRAPDRIGGLLQTQLSRADEGLRLRREGAETLSHYRWVDRERGIVRVPIDVAIDRLLAGERPGGGP